MWASMLDAELALPHESVSAVSCLVCGVGVAVAFGWLVGVGDGGVGVGAGGVGVGVEPVWGVPMAQS